MPQVQFATRLESDLMQVWRSKHAYHFREPVPKTVCMYVCMYVCMSVLLCVCIIVYILRMCYVRILRA